MARQRSYEAALHTLATAYNQKHRFGLKSLTDARSIRALVRTRLHDQFDLLLTPTILLLFDT